MAKRTFMRAALAIRSETTKAGVRSFDPKDVAAAGALMYRAYLGTVDYEGETPDDAAAEIRKTIDGSYGAFVPGCSKVLERDGSLLSATLITRFQDRPFVAFSFTDPDFSNQGLAKACMQVAMSALHAQGERELRLVVTLANLPAVHLYTKLGFAPERDAYPL